VPITEALSCRTERTSKYTKLAKLRDKSADSVVRACARVLLPLADRIRGRHRLAVLVYDGRL
jgi:hypothetical protein